MTSSTPWPWSASRRVSSISRRSSPGSRPVVGSSSNSSSGPLISSSATAARLRCPPERLPIRRSRMSFEANLLEHVGDRRLALLGGVAFGQAQAGGEGERLLDAEEVVQRVVLGDVTDVGLAQADVLTADRDGAGARGTDPPDRL